MARTPARLPAASPQLSVSNKGFQMKTTLIATAVLTAVVALSAPAFATRPDHSANAWRAFLVANDHINHKEHDRYVADTMKRRIEIIGGRPGGK
jgi:hypothetical protein